jgi:hypothetical protein
MPIYWTIDSQKQLMTAVAEGDVHQHEAVAYLDAMMAAKAGGYRRLFDGSHGEPLMSSSEIMEVAARMRRMQQEVKPGPLAVVMPADKYALFARMLGILSVPKRPMRIFASARAARAWLNEPDVRHWRSLDDEEASPGAGEASRLHRA